jgi:hypothetical protein
LARHIGKHAVAAGFPRFAGAGKSTACRIHLKSSFILFSSVELELKQPNPSIGAPFQSISCTVPQFLFGVGQDAEKPFGDNQLAKVVAFN